MKYGPEKTKETLLRLPSRIRFKKKGSADLFGILKGMKNEVEERFWEVASTCTGSEGEGLSIVFRIIRFENGIESVQPRRSREYSVWRREVFKRDNYTCVQCQIPGKHIHADHIELYSQNESRRLDVSNGQTLCVDCHAKKHPENKNLIKSHLACHCFNNGKSDVC